MRFPKGTFDQNDLGVCGLEMNPECYKDGPLDPWVSHPQVQPTMDLGEKNPEIFKKRNLNLPRTGNYFCSIYLSFTTIYIAVR